MEDYFLTYDKKPAKDYQNLYDALENYNAVPILESTWYIKKSNSSVSVILNHFQNFLNEDDGIIVTKIIDYAYRNILS